MEVIQLEALNYVFIDYEVANCTIIPGTLNSILLDVTPNFLILTSGVPLLKNDIDITGIYNDVFRTSIVKQADAIFFIREVSPLRI